MVKQDKPISTNITVIKGGPVKTKKSKNVKCTIIIACQPNASFILGSLAEECFFLLISCDLSLKNSF